MATHFDPLGRSIDLSEATWFRHILKGHPELGGHREDAQRAIAAPDAIFHSSSDTDCRLYYRILPQRRLMICVVADVAAGIVKTAYLTRRFKQGAQEWPLQNPSKEPPGPSGSITT